MFLSDILLVKRVNNFFYINGCMIKADRISSPGYAVLLVFQKSKLDKDFRCVLGPGRFGYFPSAKALQIIKAKLDLSDHLTLDLHNGKGWETGPRPFSRKLVDLI